MNVRDHDRDMYIYNARKHANRTFAEIGREMGISAVRAGQVYRRIDWELNRENADHHKKPRSNEGKVIDFQTHSDSRKDL